MPFINRVMFGSDQMVWPGTIERAIAVLEEAPFLSTQQKRDILYNNAPRFLRLSKRIWRAIARFRSGLPRVHWTSILARSDTGCISRKKKVAFSGAILSRSPRVDGLRRKPGGGAGLTIALSENACDYFRAIRSVCGVGSP
jgi:hypothetical protein